MQERLCPSMVVVPAGGFMMDSNEQASPANAASTAIEVRIKNPFAAGKYEVIVAEWQTFVEAGACPPYDWSGLSDMPMGKIRWDEAIQYIGWLSRITGKPYRLLAEAEWEYAVRAGTTTLYSFGDGEAELMTMLGTRTMPRAERTSRVCCGRMASVCTTCTATWRSMWRIASTVPTKGLPATARHGRPVPPRQ